MREMPGGKPRIAVVGADGQLGRDLVRAAENDFKVVEFIRDDFDVGDAVSAEKKISDARPDFVVNTASFHKTDECERDPEKSFGVNAVGAYHVAVAAARVGAAVVYISTDYVFGGDGKSFWEGDAPKPLNVYGASKLAGEALTRIANPRHFIVRTSALFGAYASKKGHNFVTLMLGLAREGKKVSVVDDQFTSPTYAKDLAEKIVEVIEKQPPFGVYHITNRGSVSWYGFAKKIFEFAGLAPQLEAVKTVRTGAARPLCSVLENRALRGAGIILLRPWSDALRAYLAETGVVT